MKLDADTARARKLGIAHFAFMRALVQGIALREAWDRYLQVEGLATDLRLVKGTIDWIRDAFAAAARREDRHGTARLILMDVRRLPDNEPAVPSLEDFAAERGLEDFSEAEQIEAFEAEFGKASVRQGRRAKLIARQLDALRWLEQLVAQPPRAGDAVAAWLNPNVSGRLEAVGIFTLAQLVERINGVGRNWTASIRGLGTAKAARVQRWLSEHQASLGLAIGGHVALARGKVFRHELQKVVEPATDVRPLEKLLVPAELDGRAGVYRRPQAQCLMTARNDYEAILTWLRSKNGASPAQQAQAKAKRRGRDLGVESALDWLTTLSHTQRAYRKEAERFLLWAVIERRKPLSSMTTEDCTAYRDFLGDPLPRSRWCGQRNRERWSPLWRPFEGPLSAAAQRHALTVLKNLYAYWVDKNYLMGNPWSGITVPRSALPKMNTGRSFTMAQWQFICEQVDMQRERSTSQRLKLALSLLYATGLRLSEAVAAKVDHLQWVEYPPDTEDAEHVEGWLLNVVGKGQKLRQVPVPVDVVGLLADYLIARGLDPDPEAGVNQGAYLLGKAADLEAVAPSLQERHGDDPKHGIVANTLYDQLKRFFEECGRVLDSLGHAKGADRLRRASTHWLRHTHASHAIARGTPVQIEKEILGHASLATTSVYVTTEEKRRMKAMASFWGKT
ncbi:integrase [Pseudorhodoferax aquiterrae]|uniref:Integrase n=1 Tax=Pseudorhodoferax aquiterrae TaxID=747304 RepID=A0ABQ3GIC6_9BURK|nr:phage integrase family protein [Pseudorhodoferax aquiterrae]GHD05176.1 integrase [Pseudorhodoferax aquiterrae]